MFHPWMAIDIDVHSNGKVLALAERLDVSADEAVENGRFMNRPYIES
jgi:hypothetical protein